MTGKLASASASVGPRSETVTGQASAKDVETMFQLVYMRFTAPRKDSVAFSAYRQSMEAQKANVAASPQSAFFDTLPAPMSQNAYRARPMSPALRREVNLNKSFEIYRDRFADASVADKTAFEECVRRDAHADRIRADIAAGNALHVRGTPTLIVNGTLVRGDPGRTFLEDALQRAR